MLNDVKNNPLKKLNILNTYDAEKWSITLHCGKYKDKLSKDSTMKRADN